MKLPDTVLPLSKMSAGDLVNLVRGIRSSRVTEKEEPAPSKKSSGTSSAKKGGAKKQKKLNLAALLGGLTQADMKALADELRGDPEVMRILQQQQQEEVNGEDTH